MSVPSATLLSAASFDDVRVPAPDEASIGVDYDRIDRNLDRAISAEDWIETYRAWDDVRRRLQTWNAMVSLQFQQNTKDPAFKSRVDALNALHPKIEARDVAIKRRFLNGPHRAELERELGSHVFALWASSVDAFDPRIEADLVTESDLSDAYIALLAGAAIEFESETLTLPALGKYTENPDRGLRERAVRARWDFFAANQSEIESLYDRLVRVRAKMSRTLGYENFVTLGYKRMLRTDYNADDVARYRRAIELEIVPVCERLAAARAKRLGLDELRIWDESMHSLAGNPRPPAYLGMIGAARSVFSSMNDELGDFSALMVEGKLLDLQLRDGKAGGGFCTSFSVYGLPYVFANFNGTTNDVNVLLHEMGHAFQSYSSRGMSLSEYLWPTYDACEIHSMSMEFLAYPHLERFFGGDAQRYRIQHLAASLMFLPYGAAVDHFQHLVYEHPDATPEERNGFWKGVEARYLPWRRNGGIPYLERGGFWQQQGHIFVSPFYYIDYTLALNCALQFWIRSLDDYPAALADYTALCRRGGQAPFQALVRSAGLRSPFDPGVLAAIARRVESAFGEDAASQST